MLSVLFLGAALASVPSAAAMHAGLVPTPSFRHYGLVDGLPSSNVYTVAQGGKGFMWLGTRDGLVRFDGQQFKVFRHQPDDPASLPASDISSVLVDHQGRVWAGGEGTGLNLYQPLRGGFRHWRHDAMQAGSLAGDDVWALAETPDGSIWVGMFAAGLDRLPPGGTRFQHLRHRRHDTGSISSDIVLSLKAGRHGRLWIGTATGLDVRGSDGHMRHVRFPHDASLRVWHIDGSGGDIRAATNHGLFRVDAQLQAHPVAPGRLPAILVSSSLRRADGSLWVSSADGVYRLGGDGRLQHFTTQALMPGGLRGHVYWQVNGDREGGIWLAARDGGLSYLSPEWNDFSHFSHVPDTPSSLTHNHVQALALDASGRLLVGGGDSELDRLDPALGTIEHLAPKLHLGHATVTALAPATRGRIWVATGTGAMLFDPRRGTRTPLGLPEKAVRVLIADKRGRAYLSPVGDGVLRADAQAHGWTRIATADAGADGRDTVQMGFYNSRLWRASRAGLSRLNADGLHFDFVPGVARGPLQAFDVRGDSLWLVRDSRLVHYVRRGARWQREREVKAGHGWPGALVQAVVADDRGRIWLASENGLWRYDSATGRFRDYGVHEGLPSAEFSTHAVARAADGTVYLGTLGGVVGFQPGRVRDRPHPPLVALESIRVQRHGVDVALPARQGPLRMHWTDRNLRVAARALSYIDPARNHYRFRLSGFDADWVDTGTSGERQFSVLPSGHYTLHVQAAGPGGVWAALRAPLHVDVAAPPWLRPWAFAVYAGVLALAVWLAAWLWRRRLDQRHRMQMAEQQRRMAEQASAAKTEFLATLGHEIRTPMTGVLGMAELLLHAPLAAREHRYALAIQRSGTLLLKLVNDALDLARIEAHRFELETEAFDPRVLLREVGELEAGLAASKGLELVVQVDDDVPPRVLGDGLRIRQILLNLLNNALKFTERGQVTLSLARDDQGLCFAVADSGPGIPAASRERLFQRFEQDDSPQRQTGSGLGLAICRELVALMGGHIALCSQIGKGSRFDVHLPLPEVTDAAAVHARGGKALPAACSVLLVEDDVTIAEVITGLLEAQGHQVRHAQHGLAALSEWQSQTFDAVLLDLDLPGVDGFRLARMIREHDRGAHLPIIAITARSGGDEQARAAAAGMDGFLRKPLTGEQLAAELARVLRETHSAEA